MNNDKLPQILGKVTSLSKSAGQKVLSYYGHPGKIRDKGNDSPLTKADTASNEIMVKGLREFGWPILTEEGVDDQNRFGSELIWIVDPLDGTKDFIQETGEFTVMTGLVERQANGTYRPVLGVIYRPVADIAYTAVKRQGAWKREGGNEPVVLTVSKEADWRNIKMLTSRFHTTDLEWDLAKEKGIGKVVTYGSSLKVCLIAEKQGHLNFNIAPHTWEWDVCASDILIHEAGGRFTDSEGKIINYNKKDPRNHSGYAASNGVVHDEIIDYILNSKIVK